MSGAARGSVTDAITPDRHDPTVTGRALLITKTDPRMPRDGGTLRVAAIVAALRETGWQVDIVSARSANGHRRRGRDARGARIGLAPARVALEAVRVGSASVARWIDATVSTEIGRLRRERHYDIALVEFSQMLPYLPLLKGLPVVLDMHNVEAELLENYAASAHTTTRRLVARWEASRVRRLESGPSLARVDAVVTVADRDARVVAARTGADRVRTAGNGVADEAFAVAKTATAPVVVFVAHLGWQPNIDAVRWLVGEVWPHVHAAQPDAVLRLVGRSPAPWIQQLDGRDGIRVFADVTSTYPLLADATVATAPLQAAGGTRLKILEAIATGTPVVATPLGAMGLEHLPTAALDIAATPGAFADRLLARLDEPGDPAVIRAAAEPYRWPTALAPLLAAVAELTRKDVP